MHSWDLHSICYLEKIQTRDQNLETLFKQKIEKKNIVITQYLNSVHWILQKVYVISKGV